MKHFLIATLLALVPVITFAQNDVPFVKETKSGVTWLNVGEVTTNGTVISLWIPQNTQNMGNLFVYFPDKWDVVGACFLDGQMVAVYKTENGPKTITYPISQWEDGVNCKKCRIIPFLHWVAVPDPMNRHRNPASQWIESISTNRHGCQNSNSFETSLITK